MCVNPFWSSPFTHRIISRWKLKLLRMTVFPLPICALLTTLLLLLLLLPLQFLLPLCVALTFAGRRPLALLPLTTFHLHSSRQHIAACNMQRAALIIVSVCFCCCWQFSNSWRAQNYTHFHSRLKCIPFSRMRKLPRNVAYGICKTQMYIITLHSFKLELVHIRYSRKMCTR